MANKTVQRLSVSVKTNIELTDEEIAKRKHQLREYAKVLFDGGDVGVNLTYEEVPIWLDVNKSLPKIKEETYYVNTFDADAKEPFYSMMQIKYEGDLDFLKANYTHWLLMPFKD